MNYVRGKDALQACSGPVLRKVSPSSILLFL